MASQSSWNEAWRKRTMRAPYARALGMVAGSGRIEEARTAVARALDLDRAPGALERHPDALALRGRSGRVLFGEQHQHGRAEVERELERFDRMARGELTALERSTRVHHGRDAPARAAGEERERAGLPEPHDGHARRVDPFLARERLER
jgi:hypothetical protein